MSKAYSSYQNQQAMLERIEMLEHCVAEGLLFERGGYLYNRFQLIPPLVISRDEIDQALAILDAAMTMAEQRSGIAPRAAAVR